MKQEIRIPVRLDGALFRRFALFNAFRRQRRWVRPLLFAAIFGGFAAVCFLSGRAQGPLLGTVLLLVGLGLPLVWVAAFLLQVRGQIKQAGLSKARPVYTVVLRPDGLHVHREGKDAQALDLPWTKVYAACLVRGCIYLYVSPVQAFLLPEGQGGVPMAEIWQALARWMPEGRCHLYR